MDTSTIEAIIAKRSADEHAQADLHDLLLVVSERLGKHATEADLQHGVEFIVSYIGQVPYVIKVALTAARSVGLEAEMQNVLEVVGSYWQQDDDIIPDHIGVIGLLDDAYCSLSSMQAVSDHFQLQTGKFLFPDDLTDANRAMRRIIGEPYASELDRIVVRTLRETRLIESMKRMAAPEKQQLFSDHSTIWSHGPVGGMMLQSLSGLGLLED